MNLDAIKNSWAVRWAYHLPFLLRAYHYCLAFLGALRYGFPSRRLAVIGVTGTKGKTTTAELLAYILEKSGRRTGLISTVSFKIGEERRVNDLKQTMPGRFALQKMLRSMLRSNCVCAVVETSSEGIIQYRHRFIDYRGAIFTNLTPEHIERHGGFENYRAAKVRLFERVARRDDGFGVYNLDDGNVSYFLSPPVRQKFGFARRAPLPSPDLPESNQFQITKVETDKEGLSFLLRGEEIKTPLLGEFNVANAAAAALAAHALGVGWAEIKDALAEAQAPPGRFEVLRSPKGFTLVLDYAHEPASLTALYEAVKGVFRPRRIIGILGSQGGGRDKWKREAMGKIAAKYCDELILTNEDPYDEPPEDILADIEKGAAGGKAEVRKIIDREEAIRAAIASAEKGDAVVLSGKGGEVLMCVERGKKIPWSDRETAEKALGAK